MSWLGLGTAGRALRRRSPTWVRVAEAAADCILHTVVALRAAAAAMALALVEPTAQDTQVWGTSGSGGEQGVSFKQGKLALVHLWCQTQRDASHSV